MSHASEVERVDLNSSDDAGFPRWIQVALALYLIPVLAVVLVFGLLTIAMTGAVALLIYFVKGFRLQHESAVLRAPREKLLGLIPGERFRSRKGGRCGRYMQAWNQVGEPCWSSSPTISLH